MNFFLIFDNRKRLAQWLDKDEVPKHSPNIHKKKLISVWWSNAGIIHKIWSIDYSVCLLQPIGRNGEEACNK